MRTLWLHGIKFVLQSETDEAIPNLMKLMPRIKGDILSMRASYDPESTVKNWRRQDRWDIQELNNVVTVKIHSAPEPKPGGRKIDIIPPEGYDHCLVVEHFDEPKFAVFLKKAAEGGGQGELIFYGWIGYLEDNLFDPPGKGGQPSSRSVPWANGYLPDNIQQVGRVDQGWWAYGYPSNQISIWYQLSTRLGHSDADRTIWRVYPVGNQGIHVNVDVSTYWDPSLWWQPPDDASFEFYDDLPVGLGLHNDKAHMYYWITRGINPQAYLWWPVGFSHHIWFDQFWWVEGCCLTEEDFDLLWNGWEQIENGLQSMLGGAILPGTFSQYYWKKAYDQRWWGLWYGGANTQGFPMLRQDFGAGYSYPYDSVSVKDFNSFALTSGFVGRNNSYTDGTYVSGREHEVFITGFTVVVGDTAYTNSEYKVMKRPELDPADIVNGPPPANQQLTAEEEVIIRGNEDYFEFNSDNPFEPDEAYIWDDVYWRLGTVVVCVEGAQYPIRDEVSLGRIVDFWGSWNYWRTVKFWDWGIFSKFNAGVSKKGIEPDKIMPIYCFAASTIDVKEKDDHGVTQADGDGPFEAQAFFGLVDPLDNIYLTEDFDAMTYYVGDGFGRDFDTSYCTIKGEKCRLKCRICKITRTDPSGEIHIDEY